jgi:alanyl-tRNA synthetase
MNSKDIRSGFLKYFEGQGHSVRPSSSLIPDDPGLLFTVAGMVPFKPQFLGQVKLDFTRAASCQKCIRTNDIENVGRTRRHHTFFEMLGNFSFGDYFKEDAIAWAWEFLTSPKWMGLDRDKLWVSVYEKDDEAAGIWARHIQSARIFRLGEKDNFWVMGDTGPCGPCSEIYYDFGREADPSVKEGDPAEGGDRYIEIWNNVFTQFDRRADKSLAPLPKKNIDTGMGLERLAAVKQGKTSNFDTDLFQPIIQAAASASGYRYGADARADLSLKVIADHLRGGVFLIGDGVLPGNEGRGYVLRRLLRRAVRHGRLLGVKKAFLHELYPSVEQIFGGTYGELGERKAAILAALKDEEERFGRALDAGTELLDGLMKRTSGKVLDGAEVFKLYDTFGFPLELTQEMAGEQGFSVDEQAFTRELQGQRERARAAHASGGHGDDPIYGALATKHGPTRFQGYETTRVDGARVLALLKDRREVPELKVGDMGEVLLDATPFYANSGGQLADQGSLSAAAGGDGGAALSAHVGEVLKRAGGELVLHEVLVGHGTLKTGQLLVAQVDAARRADTARHHSATHVLHAALRAVLGAHVQQAGSEVGPDGLRFDFSHNKGLSAQERLDVEDWANAHVLADSPGLVRELKIAEAKAEGAMALFGEKYGDTVRVVSFGDWSKELCGGTHVRASGELGLIKITGEGAVSSGVRRIEAVAGLKALRAWRAEQAFMEGVAASLKSTVADLPVRVGKLLEREKELAKKLDKALQGGASLAGQDAQVGAYRLFFGYVEEAELEQLKQMADKKRDELGAQAFVALAAGTQVDGEWRAAVVATSSKDAAKALPAGGFIKEFTAKFGGRGGGKPEFAQGGGGDFGQFKSLSLAGIEHVKAFAQKAGG